jgi:hypothetical protein
MIKISYCVVLLAAVAVLTVKADDNDSLDDPKHEVKIEILSKPPGCDKERKSQRGDVLTTDYVGYFPGGKKFDST